MSRDAQDNCDLEDKHDVQDNAGMCWILNPKNPSMELI